MLTKPRFVFFSLQILLDKSNIRKPYVECCFSPDVFGKCGRLRLMLIIVQVERRRLRAGKCRLPSENRTTAPLGLGFDFQSGNDGNNERERKRPVHMSTYSTNKIREMKTSPLTNNKNAARLELVRVHVDQYRSKLTFSGRSSGFLVSLARLLLLTVNMNFA